MRGGAGGGGEAAQEGALAHHGAAGQFGDRQGPVEVGAGPAEQFGQSLVLAVLGHRCGEVLGLAAVAVGGQHHVPGDVVGDGGAVLAPDQVQAEVEARGGARTGGDPAVVQVERLGFDGDARVAAGQQSGEAPVGGGAAAVEQAGGGEREGADAVGGDQGTAVVGRHQGVQDDGRGRGTEAGPGEGEHEVGGGEPVQAVGDRQRHAQVGVDAAGAVGAEGEVEARQFRPVRAEDLGDDADGEHAGTGRDVGGDGGEGGHPRSVAQRAAGDWHLSCDRWHLCHSSGARAFDRIDA